MTARVSFAVGLRADEFVDELELGIVTRITNQRPAFGRRREHHALMCKASERGALDRYRIGLEGIELHHPTESVWLVAIVLGRARRFA